VSVLAVVREWHDDEGWGVVDSPEVPGACWVSFAHVRVAGTSTLTLTFDPAPPAPEDRPG
jgi:CspA family cold shock protein